MLQIFINVQCTLFARPLNAEIGRLIVIWKQKTRGKRKYGKKYSGPTHTAGSLANANLFFNRSSIVSKHTHTKQKCLWFLLMARVSTSNDDKGFRRVQDYSALPPVFVSLSLSLLSSPPFFPRFFFFFFCLFSTDITSCSYYMFVYAL